MTSGSGRVVRLDRDALPLAFGAHRIDDLGDRSVDVHREALDRLRPDDIPQVVQEPPHRHQLAIDGPAEHLARLGIHIVARDQAGAVADVLDRMREVVHQARGDAAEHRVPLLALDVLLQLDEPIRHRVEGVAELAELVARADVDARIELAGGQSLGAALELEDRD